MPVVPDFSAVLVEFRVQYARQMPLEEFLAQLYRYGNTEKRLRLQKIYKKLK